MTRLLVATSFAIVALATNSYGLVVVNEVHYNPPGSDSTVLLEFIELHNTGATAVDLSNWELEFGPSPLVFPNGASIPAGGFIVVAENITRLAIETGYTAQHQWDSSIHGSLGNGGDDIALRDDLGAQVDLAIYDDDPPWPTSPDGNGPSLELVNPLLDHVQSSSWQASIPTNGTPGEQNSVFTNAPTVQIESPVRRSSVFTLPDVSVTFSASVTGVAAGDLTVAGSPATAVSCPSCSGGAGAGPYTFSGYAPPPAGSVTIAMSPGSIQSQTGGIPFGGSSWTLAVGLNVVLNEIHYHPPIPNEDAEFIEILNAGSSPVDMSGWTITDGLDLTIPPGTTVGAGGYLVLALNPALLQSVTGYSGALQWSSGRLSNGGERLALSDASGNEIDVVTFGDGGTWPASPDGNGPSLELVSPLLPSQYGAAWRGSVGTHGTPGAQNSVFQAAPAPIIANTLHSPAIPQPLQTVAVTAIVLDDSPSPTVTLYYRQDQDPTIAYSSTPMFDDGAHGDDAAGDKVYGATMPGLANGARLDFTIRADDGASVSAGPAGHNTLAAGQYPAQTYLCAFSSAVPSPDVPTYHMITTQRTRNLQNTHNKTEYDSTFIHCDLSGASCEIFYNAVERYRGESSLNQHPHSYRIDLPADHELASEFGFEVGTVQLMAQSVDKQRLGYEIFRQAFGGDIPTPVTQFVRFDTSPLSHGGIPANQFVYLNVERLQEEFLESQNGGVFPTRFPDRCSVSGAPCDDDGDCPSGQTCVATDNGNLYRGRFPGATLDYLGPSPENGYRTASYEKESNQDADDWTDLINLCFALDPDTNPDANFEAAVSSIVDEVEWARWFAIHMLLVNQEGGLHRDTGDDYFVYFEPVDSPSGYNAQLLPWDLDSVFGGFASSFNQETIWRTTVPNPRRFVRSNAFAGTFVGAICELQGADFSQATMNARIDALPAAVAGAARKQALKDFVAARHVFVNKEIRRQLTLTGVPASPYTNPNPVIALSGLLNQCGTRTVTVNGTPAGTSSIFNATWSTNYTLSPGNNTITVQDLDRDGAVIDTVQQSVLYVPPCTTDPKCDDGQFPRRRHHRGEPAAVNWVPYPR